MTSEVIDFRGQVLNAPESASSNRLLGDDVEPDLHLIQPGGVGRSQMDMKTGVQGQPAPHPSMFMCGVVVDDQVDVKLGRNVGLDVFQKVEIFLMPMTLFALGKDLARSDVQSREEGQGPVADIVVSDPLHVAQSHGQNRLSPVQDLNLAFLIDTENHGIFRGVQIEADDVSDFFDEKGVGGDLKVALPVRLQAEGLPDSLDRRSRNGGFLGHRADRPMGAPWRFAVECFADELGDLFIGNGSGAAGTQLIMQAGNSLFPVTLPPQAYGLAAVVDLVGDVAIGQALGRHQDNLGPGDQAVGQGSRAGDGVQFRSLLSGKHDGSSRSSCSHGRPPCGQAHDSSKILYSQVIYETQH
jgi:hypothetical protein